MLRAELNVWKNVEINEYALLSAWLNRRSIRHRADNWDIDNWKCSKFIKGVEDVKYVYLQSYELIIL